MRVWALRVDVALGGLCPYIHPTLVVLLCESTVLACVCVFLLGPFCSTLSLLSRARREGDYGRSRGPIYS